MAGIDTAGEAIVVVISSSAEIPPRDRVTGCEAVLGCRIAKDISGDWGATNFV